MEITSINDLTLDHISSDGSGTELDLIAFKAACWRYLEANTCTEREAIDVIFGDGDFGARLYEWAPEEAAAAAAQEGK
jgi:hypothetical protein